jgi:diacylglycerol kinase family enzyme
MMRMVMERRSRWEPQLEIVGMGRAAFLFVAKCDPYTYAGAVPLHVAPRARFEDGLDIVAPQRVRPVDVPRLLTYVVRGGRKPRNVLAGHDLDRVEVRCDRPLPVQADGEDLGDAETLLFEAERDAVSVLM